MSLNQKHLGKLGKRIRRIRTDQSMSQAALAEYIGCSSAFLSYIENGKKLPSLEMLLTIANALCVTTDMLLADYLEHNLRGAILIVLGDVGLNYYGGRRDRIRKMLVEALPITMFCIHGNHEQRPETLSGYTTTSWHGGTTTGMRCWTLSVSYR